MKILAIETSNDICSVSVLEDNNLILELKEETANNHSEALMPLIDKLLKETSLSLNEIDLFAVDIGPGSFTGIRIGLSTIKAFCDVTNKPCIGISSLEALAWSIWTVPDNHFQKDCHLTSPLLTCSMIDAKHGNIYSSIFEKNEQGLVKYRDFSFEKLDDLLLVLSNLKKNIFFVGNCGILYKDVIQSYLENNIFFENDSLASSKYIGIAAYERFKAGEIQISNTLSALYLKKSSAEDSLEANT